LPFAALLVATFCLPPLPFSHLKSSSSSDSKSSSLSSDSSLDSESCSSSSSSEATRAFLLTGAVTRAPTFASEEAPETEAQCVVLLSSASPQQASSSEESLCLILFLEAAWDALALPACVRLFVSSPAPASVRASALVRNYCKATLVPGTRCSKRCSSL